jgi:hypothetical protein
MNSKLLALGLLCALAAGCGGSSSTLSASAYRARLAAIGQEAAKAQQDVQQGLQAKTVAGLSARLKAFAAADDRLGTEVGDLNPPKDAATANAALAKAEHDTAQAIRSALPQISSQKSVKEALAQLQANTVGRQAGMEIDAALKQLKALGYTTQG